MPRPLRSLVLLMALAAVPLFGPGVARAQDGTPAAAGAAGCWTAEQSLPEPAPDGGRWTAPPTLVVAPANAYTATMRTTSGEIQLELFPADAPLAVNNFVCLARAGFYDATPIHRIVPGFVIQGGDPTGTGTGGPGYEFADEPIARDYEQFTLAMANAGPNTNGSQFFIVLEDLRGQLPKNYTIFGRVTVGQDVVAAIAAIPTQVGASGEPSEPTEPITIETVTITETVPGTAATPAPA